MCHQRCPSLLGGQGCWSLKSGRWVSPAGLWAARLWAFCANRDVCRSEPAWLPWPPHPPGGWGAAGQFCALLGTPLPIFLRLLPWPAPESLWAARQLLPGPPAPSPGLPRSCAAGKWHPCPGTRGFVSWGPPGMDAGGCWGMLVASHGPSQQPALGAAADPFTSLLVWAAVKAGGDPEPHHCGHFFFFSFLFSLLFNEPTLGDLERRSCSFAVTYLPASAPYSAEGINLGSQRGASAEPVPPRGAGAITHGRRGGLPGGGRGVDIAARRRDGWAAWGGAGKTVPLQWGTNC